jgi:hypothetical protein
VWCRGAFDKHYPIFQVVLWCSFFYLLLTWETCGGNHHYWIIFKHKAWWPLKRWFICLVQYQALLNTIMWAPSYVFPSLKDDTHIMGPLSEITCAFYHLSTQLALVGLKVKVSKCKLWNPLGIFPNIEIPHGYILVIYGLCVLSVLAGS